MVCGVVCGVWYVVCGMWCEVCGAGYIEGLGIVGIVSKITQASIFNTQYPKSIAFGFYFCQVFGKNVSDLLYGF